MSDKGLTIHREKGVGSYCNSKGKKKKMIIKPWIAITKVKLGREVHIFWLCPL
jgi:hypothetical protein